MKRYCKMGILSVAMLTLLAGCGQEVSNTHELQQSQHETSQELVTDTVAVEEITSIVLSDEMITVDGQTASTDTSSAVYTAKDIIYYEDGMDFMYGAGTAADEHTREEADAHTVLHITEPGTYEVSGSLSAGQLAIDLGEDAKEDSEAVVTLLLNGVDIHCSVAPAIIFYNVYECSTDDAASASMTVDTTAAGANVIIADGTENNVTGSYVAKIYKSVELNEDGTEVVDSKKLHKYDGAFYSKMSMNVSGGEEGSGVLNITAENEGLDSELHLTINGGNINIIAGNDGINTNEDGISVTTINGGNLNIVVDGSTGEGDGIDSNGWLVINGGTVIASACGTSADSGIDSDNGIYINGGSVMTTGNMLDEIAEGTQNYAVFGFRNKQNGQTNYELKNAAGEVVAEIAPANAFSYLIFSSEDMEEGNYTLWAGDTQLSGMIGDAVMAGAPGMRDMMGDFEGVRPEDATGMPQMSELPEGVETPERKELPEGAETPERKELPEGTEVPERKELPEGTEVPERKELPEGTEAPERKELPEGMERPEENERPMKMWGQEIDDAELTTEFQIVSGGNYFSNVAAE